MPKVFKCLFGAYGQRGIRVVKFRNQKILHTIIIVLTMRSNIKFIRVKIKKIG